MITNLAPNTDVCLQHKTKNKSKFTCIPIGLTQGKFNLHAFKITEQYKWFQMRSVCLMAFCHLHIRDPLKWSSHTINTILIDGAKVVKVDDVRVSENGPLDCVLNMENFIAEIRIEEPIYLNAVNTNASLIDTLQRFFDDHKHGLFRCLNLCYLMWKMNGIHFLFDSQGTGSAVDDKNGLASLVCTESLKDVGKLLKTLSSMKPDDCYTISPIKMVHFRNGVSNFTQPRIHYVCTQTFTIVSESFAILSGKFHVGRNAFQSFKQHQSMPVNLMALIYRAILPANSWNSQVVDKIVLLGTKLFHECRKTPQGEVTIHLLPRRYNVLAYEFTIDYKPFTYTGQMNNSLDEMKKDLSMYLHRAFAGGTDVNQSVFIQTNSLIFAVWESDNYFYIFDAYARNGHEELTVDRSGAPCIQMHNSLDSLCNVLVQNLNVIAANSGFIFHGVNVTLSSNGDGKAIADADLVLINSFMDDQFWMEMNNYQESSAKSEKTICNLNESSDDDIFMETVGGLRRAVSSIDSSESRSTASLVSEWATSESRTDTASKDTSSSNTQSMSHSESQVSEPKKERSKSPKKRKAKKNVATDEHSDQMEAVPDDEVTAAAAAAEQNVKKMRTEKRDKRKPKADADDAHEIPTDERSEKHKRKDKKHQNDAQAKDQSKAKGKNEAQSKGESKAQIKGESKAQSKGESEAQSKGESEAQIKGHSEGENKQEAEKSSAAGEASGHIESESQQVAKQCLVVVESSSGTESSITKLLTTSFKISDRVILVTDWGDFFAAHDNNSYFLCDGCLCDYNTLIQIDVSELNSSKKLDSIDGIVSKIMGSRNTKNVTIQSNPEIRKDSIQSTEIGDLSPPFSSNLDAPLWELIEGMVELMKTTEKFDKIKNELV